MNKIHVIANPKTYSDIEGAMIQAGTTRGKPSFFAFVDPVSFFNHHSEFCVSLDSLYRELPINNITRIYNSLNDTPSWKLTTKAKLHQRQTQKSTAKPSTLLSRLVGIIK